MVMDLVIEDMKSDDWPSVREIYEEGIASGVATFERAAPSWEEWNTGHLQECRLVARMDGRIVAWAALSPVSDRCVYGGVAEVSIYVAASSGGRGIGKALLDALIKESEKIGVWTLQGGIFPENEASVRLHRSCGFREVGRRERLGQLEGEWKDVLLMERRSRVVGV
jgi:phosphinothricin acetyltransferase